MASNRHPQHAFARLTAALALCAILTTGSIATAGAQEEESGDGDDDDVEGADSPTSALDIGEYEPCSAYFGFGKGNGAQELVRFDVSVDGEHDGPVPGVGDGVEVVLHIELEDATVIECVPFQVTEDDWIAAFFGIPLNNPPFPGPGHYAYPSVNFPDAIGVVDVTSVAFRVVEIPDELFLVSPPEVALTASVESELVPLAAIFASQPALLAFPNPLVDPIVLDGAGPAALAAWTDAVENCPATSSPDLDAAIQAILDYAGIDGSFPTDPDCFYLFILSSFGAWASSAYDTVGYSEPIVLGTDPVPPTPDADAEDAAAEAVAAAPRFTG